VTIDLEILDECYIGVPKESEQDLCGLGRWSVQSGCAAGYHGTSRSDLLRWSTDSGDEM